MRFGTASIALLAAALAGCAGERWPEPPPVDQAAYASQYADWRKGQQETAAGSMKIVGIWPLPDGDTAFGSDSALPVVLPAAAPARAGVFTRKGSDLSVTPAAGSGLRFGGGGPVPGTSPVDGDLELGSLRLTVLPMPPDRVFVMATDENHAAVRTPPDIAAYPIDARWRVTARFDAFEVPKMVTIEDVRGGSSEIPAVGQLVFRIDGAEQRLTALGEPGSEELFVMFRDETSRTTTYGGFRMLSPKAVANGAYTVLDFNLASNPPCAYSKYTTCPLPPRENTLDVAIEAGEKRHPSAEGWSPL